MRKYPVDAKPALDALKELEELREWTGAYELIWEVLHNEQSADDEIIRFIEPGEDGDVFRLVPGNLLLHLVATLRQKKGGA